jgi:hypothetical protein
MSSVDKRLRRLFHELPRAEQETLLAFAEFLHSRAQPQANTLSVQDIPRPPQESVVGALKRLAATYPMLDKSLLLNETSPLMSQHVLQGRPAHAVIDELEALFSKHYQTFLKKDG